MAILAEPLGLRKAEWEKWARFGFVNISQSFPPQNKNQGCFGASDPYTELLFGEGPEMQQSHIAH